MRVPDHAAMPIHQVAELLANNRCAHSSTWIDDRGAPVVPPIVICRVCGKFARAEQ